MESAKILLVDDEQEFTDILSERLTDRGYNVESAKDGFEAINKVGGSNYDAIFLDLAMPGIDGIETLKKIIAKNPDLQIYLLTGKATLQKGIEAVKLGAIDVLEKPVDITELVNRIKDAQTQKMVLMQTELEHKIGDILHSKGW